MNGLLAFTLALAPINEPGPPVERELEKEWHKSAEKVTWRSPGLFERRRFGEGMRRILAAAGDCDADLGHLQAHLSETPFTIARLEPQKVWTIREHAEQRAGGGLYLLRCGPSRQGWLLQAPHSLHDLNTRAIVLRLFARTNAAAAYFNTVHRYGRDPERGKAERIHPADMAHQYGSFFQAATLAAMTETKWRVVQVHGFRANEKRPHRIIVSTGLAELVPSRLASTLSASYGSAAAYGGAATSLGATTNVQALVLNREEPGRFLHIELDSTLRSELLASGALEPLWDALQESWW